MNPLAYFAGGTLTVFWLGLGLFQMAAIIAGINAFVHGWVWAILIWAAIFFFHIPFVGDALAFYGAYGVWGWHWFWALLFAAPGLVFSLIYLGVLPVAVLSERFRRA